ncbi:hypothetical protein U1Q18_023825 [Sarracenia purpurea var. burkii]
MLLHAWSSTSGSGVLSRRSSLWNKKCRKIISEGVHFRLLPGKPITTSATLECVVVGIHDIAEIAHNKVLIAAAVSAGIGQLSKPFTSAILSGNTNSFDFKTAFQAGGFPSTHSSAVVATAMSLGLERGFSDAVFGLAVVYASLVMYDAQGVRREVGIHAKALNRVLLQNSVASNDTSNLIDGAHLPRKSSEPPLFLEEAYIISGGSTKQTNGELLVGSEKGKGQSQSGGMLMPSSLAINDDENDDDDDFVDGESDNSLGMLKESVGHNEFEVIAGAVLGLLVSVAVYAILPLP